MVKKYSQKVMNKKEALRCDCVCVERKDFCFPNVKANKAFMKMSSDSLNLPPQHANITVNYYNNEERVVESVMQPCGDVYVTYYDKGKAEQTVCVNQNCKEGILLTEDSMENLLPSDERTRYAKRIALQSVALWKGYVEGKYPTNTEKSIMEANRLKNARL